MSREGYGKLPSSRQEHLEHFKMEAAVVEAAKAGAEALAQKMQAEAAGWKAKEEAAGGLQTGYGVSQSLLGHTSGELRGWASSVLQGKTYYYCSAKHPLGGSLPPSQINSRGQNTPRGGRNCAEKREKQREQGTDRRRRRRRTRQRRAARQRKKRQEGER